MSYPGDEADLTGRIRMSDDTTDLNWRTRGLKVITWLISWSRVHDVTAAIIGGALVGFVLGKVL